MKIQKVDAFICTDKKMLTSESKAMEHQRNLAYAAIDGVMKAYGKANESVHYPNLSTTLVPYMEENATELIVALRLSVGRSEYVVEY